MRSARELCPCGDDEMVAHPARQISRIAGDPDFTSDMHRNQRLAILRDIHELRGKDLCCWCRTDQKCHADVLLEMANQ